MYYRSFKLLSALAVVCGLGFALTMPMRAQERVPATAKTQEAVPAPAQTTALVQAAQQTAGKQHKPVLVMFHASW